MIRARGKVRSLELSTLFRWFIVYSVIGWLFETAYTYSVSGNLTKRGFLFGPLCPIYGLTMIFMIILCSDRCKGIISLMIRCALVSTAMEYFTSFWMEHLLNKRWWDYSNMFMNVNGRICLGASVLFGIMGAVFIRLLHPTLMSLTSRISDRVMRILDGTVLVLFLYDILLSFRANIR